MQPCVLFVHCPPTIFLFKLSYFIMFDGQERLICFMNRADLSSCQSLTATIYMWIPLRVTSSSLTVPCSSSFPSCLSIFLLSLPLSIFNPHALSFLPSILNSLKHKHPIDFSLDEGHKQSIRANGMTTADECTWSSIANSELVTQVQSWKCHPTLSARTSNLQ